MSAVTHTPGPWRPGKQSDSIVSDAAVQNGPGGADCVEYYGGHLIAESVAICNAPVIAAAPEILDAREGAYDYLNTILAPCDDDCECLLHTIERALVKAGRQAFIDRVQAGGAS